MSERLKTILVVDDSRLLQMSMELVLRRYTEEGFRVYTVSDANEGLRLMRSDPDTALVLLDLNMPEMDGWEFLQACKADEDTKEIPVIIITAHVENGERERGRRLGATDFFAKPLDFDALQKSIDRSVGWSTNAQENPAGR